MLLVYIGTGVLGAILTDYRRTEEDLWDEDVVADEDRLAKVLPVPDRGAAEPAEARPERVGLGGEGPEGGAARAASGSASQPAARDVAGVAAFIAGRAPPEGPARGNLAGASWALSGLDAGDEEVTVEARPRTRSLPPAIPPDARPPASAESLPSMMLGPSMSTRSDVTERITTIPKTHPLANSLAPGGSTVTVPPRSSRSAQRRQVTLGAVAFLTVAAGAALFLQSRGEHHAAGAWGLEAARDEHDLHAQREERELERAEALLEQKVLVEPMEETVVVIDDPPAPVLLEPPPEAAGQPKGSSSEAFSLLSGGHQVEPEHTPEKRPRPSAGPQHAPEARPVRGESQGTGLHVVVGDVQLRTGEKGAPVAAETAPNREQIIASMNELASQLSACVGDEHGIADVTLTVRGSGVVSHALVEGSFAGSEKGSCIAQALRGARLPPFAAPVLRLAYPLQL